MKNSSIGTRGESSLHRFLKYRYSARGKTEEEVDGFIADGINQDGEIIEVQTGSFGPLKKKMPVFAALGSVNIIHPIIISKYIETFDENGKRLYRRKSPRRGSEWDLFNNLLYAPELVLIPGLCIELVMVDVIEKRVRDGKGSWHRKGASIQDRELCAWHGCRKLKGPADFRVFIPFAKDEEFTTAQLAQKAGIDTGLALKTINVLKKISVIQKTGTKGRAWLYQLSGMSSSSRLFSAKRSVTARRSSK